jgi:hypothetical protein
MGWTSYRTNDSFMEVFKSEYRQWHQPDSEHLVRQSVEMKVSPHDWDEGTDSESEIWSAIEWKGKGIYAHVLLMSKRDGEVYFKGMDETVGPYSKTRCPDEIFNLLTPLPEDIEGYSKDWRARR